jgi:predicted ATP-dependent endonuclease of OLD family
MSDQKLYLHEAILENYRLIQKCAITFEPGLNIVIGRNSSGKTTVLDFLYAIITNKFNRSFFESRSTLLFEDSNKKYKLINEIDQKASFIFPREYSNRKEFIVDGKSVIKDDLGFSEDKDLNALFHEYSGYFLVPQIIKYNYPEKIAFFSSSFNTRAKRLKAIQERPLHVLQKYVFDADGYLSWFGWSIFERVILEINTFDNLQQEFDYIAKDFCTAFSNKLKKVSSVTNIRISPAFKIEYQEQTNEISIQNFQVEFCTNNTWNIFDQLSDGTKRVVFIIDQFIRTPLKNDTRAFLYFLEEPELGIHPHQLFQLATFLKEESEDKQIIVTTHSPIILDTLGKDELNRIIISEFDNKQGITLRHMTDEEMHDAKAYMSDEGYLSDYWLHSDFNRR